MLLVYYGVSYGDNVFNYKNDSKKYMTEVIYSVMETFKSNYSIQQHEIDYINTAHSRSMIVFNDSILRKSNWEYNKEFDKLRNKGWQTIAEKLLKKWEPLLKKDFITEKEMKLLLEAEVKYPYPLVKDTEVFSKKILRIKKYYNQLLEGNKSSLDKNKASYSFLFLMISIFLNIILIVICIWFFIGYKKKDILIKISQDSLKSAQVRINDFVKKEQIRPRVISSEDKNDVKLSSTEQTPICKKVFIQEKISPVALDEIVKHTSTKIYFEDFENGGFAVVDGRKTKGVWSIFCVTTISEKTGRLDLLYNEMPEDIIVNRQTYLHHSICDLVYQEGGSIDKIVSVRSGEVILEDDKWIVSKKLNVIIK